MKKKKVVKGYVATKDGKIIWDVWLGIPVSVTVVKSKNVALKRLMFGEEVKRVEIKIL